MKHRILIIIALFFVLVSCGTLDFSDQPQGIIEYDVTYVTNKSSMPTNLLPKHVVLKFHAHKSITTIEGFMGMFIFSNISDFKRHTNITLLKVIDKKYYYEGSKNEYPIFFEDMSKIKIINTNDKNIIAGLTCKKALITYLNSEKDTFEVYYTNDIDLKNPNKGTPFEEIDGVLLAFNLKLNTVEMRITANKYLPEPVSTAEFEVPDNYVEISRKKMMSVLSKLLE